MCIDPITAISLGGGALGAAGSLLSGNANAKAAGIQAQAAEANSQMALDYGEGKVAQIGQRVDQTIGRARTTFAAGNLAVNMGSPLAVQAMSAQQGNTDKQLALAGSLNQAAGQSFAASSALTRQGQDQMAGIFGAGTAMLGGLRGMYGAGGALAGGGGGVGSFNGNFGMAPTWSIGMM